MAPTRSASAPTTPAGKSSSVLNIVSKVPQTTPRKVPHCTKCHRPRAGHPRQGCPYVESPTPVKPEDPITDALKSLHIEPEDVKANTERRPRRSSVKPTPVPDASLESINTDTDSILGRLLQPGMMGNDVEEHERRASVTRWQNMIATPAKSEKVLARMPGTLITPSTTFSSGSDKLSSVVGTGGSLQSADGRSSVRMSGAISTSPTTKLAVEPPFTDLVATQEESTASQGSSVSCTKLMRSMSIEERDTFLNDLVGASKAPPATVFVLPIEEIPAVQQSSAKLGFHCRIHDLENGDGWLIIGVDKEAVEGLFAGVEGRAKEKTNTVRGGFKTAVGGAIVGSMATWTGLAFA